MVYDRRAKRWAGADGRLVCDPTAVRVQKRAVMLREDSR
jgi:hypothetical protein